MNMKIPAILIALLVLGALDAAAKVDIDSITVTLSDSENDTGDDSYSMDVGEGFFVHISLDEPDDDEEGAEFNLVIKVDDVVVYSEKEEADLVDGEDYELVISSDDFDENDLWTDNLMAYECGEVDVSVTASGRDLENSRTDEATLDINGDELNVDIDPEDPTTSEEMTISVVDEDDDEVRDATVRITNLGDDYIWDSDDKTWDDTTNSKGEVEVTLEDEFSKTVNGKYQIDVYKADEFCKSTMTIDARQGLNIEGIEPAAPSAGESVKLRVTDDDGKGVAGAKVTWTITRTNEVKTASTDMSGYLVFQVNTSGTVSFVATKSGYADSAPKQVSFTERSSMNVKITPEAAEVGKAVEIAVTGTGNAALKNARVVITKPDATTEDYQTNDAGKVTYTPASVGTYKVKVEAATYATKNAEFAATNVFDVSFTDGMAPNAEITLSVKDSQAKPVQGASVSIREAGIAGTTDFNGKYVFRLTSSGSYTVSVKKEGYRDYEQNIEIVGALTVKVSEKQVDIGKSIDIAVLDGQGNTVSDATVKVTRPDGTEDVVSEGTYKTVASGVHTVSATKTGYSEGTVGFEVNPYQMTLKASVSGSKIIVIATSDGKPVQGATIAFNAPGLYEEVETDSEGKAQIDVAGTNVSGKVTISSKEKNYEETSITQEVKAASSGDSSTLLVILVALVILVIAIIAITTKGGKKREKGMLYRTTGTHLDK